MDATCPICFEHLDGKVKASPCACDHVFCLPCLEKWAKLGSFCPVDRKRFKKIVNLESGNLIQVKTRKRKREKTVYDFSAKCEICLNDKQSEVLLLCDCCDLAFHMFCLSPPLKAIPAGLWFCPTCISVEAKLKKKKGITKESEADLGNAKLHLEGRKILGNVSRVLTRSRQQNSLEKSVYEGKEPTQNKPKNGGSVNNERISMFEASLNVESELEDASLGNKCCQDVSINTSSLNQSNNKKDETKSCNSGRIKISKTYDKQRSLKIKPSQGEMHKVFNATPQSTHIDDICLKNNLTNNVSLLDDCFSQAVVYGDMKMGKTEEIEFNGCEIVLNSYTNKKSEKETSFSKNHSVECLKTSNANCKEKIDDWLSNEGSIEHHPIKIIPYKNNNQECYMNIDSLCEERTVEDIKPEAASNVKGIEHSCSFNSAGSNKGTFKNSISGVCAESCFERSSGEVLERKSVERNRKGKIQFSVFERIDDIDASQKKYSEINSRACISFSSNLNISHCFSCKDMIPTASRNYCKICKLRYMKNALSIKNFRHKKKSNSQAFESSGDLSMSNYKQRNISKKMSTLEKRQYSLIRQLRKICNSKKKKN